MFWKVITLREEGIPKKIIEFFAGIGYVDKISKNKLKWMGPNEIDHQDIEEMI